MVGANVYVQEGVVPDSRQSFTDIVRFPFHSLSFLFLIFPI